MRDIAILGFGIFIGYVILKNQNLPLSGVRVDVKPGDKSKDIEGMQKVIERIAGLKFYEYGQYDADTLASIQYLMKGTSALKNYEKGLINPVFVSDLSKIYENSLNN